MRQDVQKRGRGRPAKTPEAQAQEAARVLDIALALYRVRTACSSRREEVAKALGFAGEAQALAFLRKRRRGAVASYIAGDVEALVGKKENRTNEAVRLHLDHGVGLGVCAGITLVDIRNLRRAVAKEKAERSARMPSILSVEVHDLN